MGKVNYNLKELNFKKIYRKSSMKWTNIFRKLGLYDFNIPKEMFNDFPDEFPDYDKTHMGIFNDDNYCDNHDLLVYSNQSLLSKRYFMTDYHHLSFIRSQVIYKTGYDVMP